LETDATKLQTEVSELRVRAAKGEAQNQFDVERIQMLTRDLETRQGEINHLRSSTSRLHKQIEACEKQMESMGQEMTSERAELSRLRRQSTLMEAECENLRSNDQRWRAEEQRLVAERTSLTQILENTTKMREEWQRASEAQVEQVRERLEANRQETDAVRQELKQARDSSERAQYKFDSELCELRSQIQQREERISQLQDQILAGKELQAKIQGERHEIELSRDDLQRQVATLEERIEGQELLMERAQSQGHTVSKEALLTVQLQDARTQLETLKSELETTQRRSEDYRQLATTNDISLKELSETYDQYKSQNDRTTAEQSARIAELDASLQASNAALNQCRSDLSSVTKRLQKMQAEMGEQKDNYAARLAKLDEENQFKARSLSALRDELERRDEAAQSMQVQYEKEVVMHAEVIKSSLLTRERLIETQRRLADIGGQLQASRDSNNQLQAQLNQARDKAADEIKSTRGQLADTRRQNSLLLAHLESLGHEVPDISVDPEKVAASAETDTAGGTGDTAAGTGTSSQTGLRDVVVYLRRERDLATAQLELAQQESQRLQQQCTYTQRMLDEVRNELLQYTPTGDADPLSNDNGSLRSESSADIIMKGNGPITLTATQRQSCQKQIKEILILRDSNSVLRSDMESTKRRLRDTERDLSHFRDQEVPRLQKDNGSLRAELQSVRTQVTQLTGMCEQWKQRHENMLAKYSMIEPEVYEALKVENQELKTRFERLEAENKQLQQRIAQAAEQQLSTDARKMTLLQSEIARLKKQIESQLLQLASEKDHARIQDSQIDSLREAVKAKESAIQTSNKEVADSQVKFEKLRDVFQRLRQQSVEKLEQSNMVIKGHESTIQVLTEQINASQRQQQPAASTGPEADAETLRRLEGEISALTKEKDEALAGYQNLAGELQETRAALQAARAQLLEKSQAQTQAQTQPQTQEEGVSSDNTTASAAEINRLKSELAAAEAKVNEYKGQLEELKVRASKYFSDNRVLQAKASALEKRLSEASTTLAPSTELQQQLEQTQKQLGEAQKQLAESDAKIEQAQATAKKMAELRSRLQISRETKRADDLAKQVDELQTKIGVLESGTGSLKRPMETDDGPSKKAHTEESS
ncbi:Filament-forming protein, partial [Kickxella alabastrina]